MPVDKVSASSSGGPSEDALRSERLRYLHGAALELLTNELRLGSERSGVYLVAMSILAAGVGVVSSRELNDLASWCCFGIAVLAVGVTLLHLSANAKARSALGFWRRSMVLIEADSDFWWPRRVRGDTDLDLTSARIRFWQGHSTRQSEVGAGELGGQHAILEALGGWIDDPGRAYLIWMPGLIGIAWGVAAVLLLIRAIVLSV